MMKKSRFASRAASARPVDASPKLRQALFSLQRSLYASGEIGALFQALRAADSAAAARLLAMCNNDPELAGLALSTLASGSQFTVLDALLVGDTTRTLADTERLIATLLREASRVASQSPQ